MDAGRERMVRLVGERYADCDFTNFDVGKDKNTHRRIAVGKRVFEYANSIQKNRREGKNLILSGPIGTGKDHLAVAVIRAALAKGLSVALVRGSVLWKEMQDGIKSGDGLSRKYASRDFLVLSDIEPRADEQATVFFQESLLDLIDGRYRDRLPTIVTTNQLTRASMEATLGERTIDRLLETSITVKTAWPSFRNKNSDTKGGSFDA